MRRAAITRALTVGLLGSAGSIPSTFNTQWEPMESIKTPIRKLITLLNKTKRKLRYDFNYRQVYIKKENIPIIKPVFFLGTQGGGLTIVSRMIRRIPDVVCITGNYKSWAGNDELQNAHSLIKNIPDKLTLGDYGIKECIRRIPYHETFGYERFLVYATDDLMENYRLTEEDYENDVEVALKCIIRKCILAYATDIQNARFVDKSQSYTLKIRFLKKLLCDCNPKFVLIVRNPYTICYRTVTEKYSRFKNMPSTFSLEQKLDLACQHWKNTYEVALDDSEGLRNLRIYKIEDILEDPYCYLKNMCEFLELDFHSDIIPQSHHKLPRDSISVNKWYPLQKDINNNYLQKVRKEEIEIIDRYCGKLAEYFGYSKPEM